MSRIHTQQTPDIAREPHLIDGVADARACIQGIAELYRLVEKGKLELLRSESDVTDMDSSCRMAFYGRSATSILGYASYQLFEPQPLNEFFLSEAEMTDCYVNKRGRHVSTHTISSYDGFSDYGESGAILFIDRFEIIGDHQEQGYGRDFLASLIKQCSPEIVFLHAAHEDAKNFFKAQGFSSSGIFNGSPGEEPVLVYLQDSFLTSQFPLRKR